MPEQELLIDRQLREILTPLGVTLGGGITEELPPVTVISEGKPNLTRELTDSFYDHWGKFIIATTALGTGYLSYTTLNDIGRIDNSMPDLVLKGVIVASSIVGGASVGFIGGFIGGLGIALIGEKVEKIEDMIRRRFS